MGWFLGRIALGLLCGGWPSRGTALVVEWKSPEQRIPFGNDRKKSKGNGKSKGKSIGNGRFVHPTLSAKSALKDGARRWWFEWKSPEQQIPFGNDRKKSKGNCKGKGNGKSNSKSKSKCRSLDCAPSKITS